MTDSTNNPHSYLYDGAHKYLCNFHSMYVLYPKVRSLTGTFCTFPELFLLEIDPQNDHGLSLIGLTAVMSQGPWVLSIFSTSGPSSGGPVHRLGGAGARMVVGQTVNPCAFTYCGRR